MGRSGLITRKLLGVYDSNIYGLWGIVIVQTLTFFPVVYLMLKGLLKNIDPSMEEASRDMGASRWKVFTSVTLPLLLPGLGNAFLVTFIESVADFANPMIIGGSYDTLATTIYLRVTGGTYSVITRWEALYSQTVSGRLVSVMASMMIFCPWQSSFLWICSHWGV